MSRSLKALAAALLVSALAITGCSSDDSTGSTTTTAPVGTFDSGHADYDAIINAGAVATAATIDANEWAKAVKAAGVLKVGGTTTGLFSLEDPATGIAYGFDAGLSQLLSRYILGDAKAEITQVTSSTRESVLETNAVDVVFATYSILPSRLERINFAGPYYASQSSILVLKTNTEITGVADLAGKKVAVQAGSAAVALLETEAPAAEIVALPDDAQCVTAVVQGRVDAYVVDSALLLRTVTDNQDVKMVGEPFGPVDAYGIGVNKENDGKAFIDLWLQQIIDDGTWLNLWKATVQATTGTEVLPATPVINSAGNA
ncbi:MAG: transporter substrate-binding domain-containing protein [Propionibacteriaceae bacterium]|jgi:glutamate transport system substrate-binding protein|nr:transporter substrate-binding domain-containing protein [Propionibacteriaceae bacterium]